MVNKLITFCPISSQTMLSTPHELPLLTCQLTYILSYLLLMIEIVHHIAFSYQHRLITRKVNNFM